MVTTLSTLDPRAPLVLDTRELGRRPGSQRRLFRSVPAPAGLGIGVVGVPVGSPVQLELRLEAVMEGVLVTGAARARVVGECARCLTAVEEELEVDLQELYAYDDPDPARVEDDETSRLHGDYLDLGPLVRDELVLALPFGPLCQQACPGLCPDCGARLADDPEHSHGEQVDPRWAGLAALTDRVSTGRDRAPGTEEE